jgi:hypothetical protein
MSTFGVVNAECLISDSKKSFARVIGFSKPRLLLSADVAKGEGAFARFLLGRACSQLREKSALLAEIGRDEIRLYFAAAAKIAGIARPGALAQATNLDDDTVEDAARVLQKRLSRGERKELAQQGEMLAAIGDPGDWRRASLVTGARAGLLWSGDVDAAFDAIDVGRGGRALADDAVGLALLHWAVGGDHIVLRSKLGRRDYLNKGAANDE